MRSHVALGEQSWLSAAETAASTPAALAASFSFRVKNLSSPACATNCLYDQLGGGDTRVGREQGQQHRWIHDPNPLHVIPEQLPRAEPSENQRRDEGALRCHVRCACSLGAASRECVGWGLGGHMGALGELHV